MNIIQQDLLPISLLVPKYIQNIPDHKVLTALFDSGGTLSLIHEQILLSNIVPLIGPTQNFTTLAGDFQSNQQVLLEEIVLPEFKYPSYIDSQQCQVFSGPCCYDIILGHDFLRKVHFHIDFQNNTITCMDMSVAMRSSEFFTDNTCLRNILFFDDVDVDSYASIIKESMYKSVSIADVIAAQSHLSSEQAQLLSKMLEKHTTLFDGILKVYPHHLVHLDVAPNAIPKHLRAYPVAHIHLDVLKIDLQRLCNIGVLERCGASQWASLTFIIPKKTVLFVGSQILESSTK